MTTAVSPAGRGAVAPPSGGYHAAGTVVNVSAVANAGFAFQKWNGNVASTNSAATTITMNKPESITANFRKVR